MRAQTASRKRKERTEFTEWEGQDPFDSDQDQEGVEVSTGEAQHSLGFGGKVPFSPIAEWVHIEEAYADDIHDYLLELEMLDRPLAGYMKYQFNLDQTMRAHMIEDLVEISDRLGLTSDCIHLGVSYVDRYLSCEIIDDNEGIVNLVGLAALWIGSKFFDCKAPEAWEFCPIGTGCAFSSVQLIEMEYKILDRLNYTIFGPTTKSFIRTFVRDAQESEGNPDIPLMFLCSYIADLSLLAYELLEFCPSQIAASALFLARFILQPALHPWNSILEEKTNYRPRELIKSVQLLCAYYSRTRGADCGKIKERYSRDCFKRVATMELSAAIPSAYFEEHF